MTADVKTLLDLSEAIGLPDADLPAAAAPQPESGFVLQMSELLPDESNAVVLSTGDDLRLTLTTEAGIVDRGISDHHVTAAGIDVTGFEYYSLSSGLTLYCPLDSLVTIYTHAG